MRKPTIIYSVFSLIVPLLLLTELTYRHYNLTDNSLTLSPLVPSPFVIHELKSEINVSADSIEHRLVLQMEVLANISYQLDFHLHGQPELTLVNSNHQLRLQPDFDSHLLLTNRGKPDVEKSHFRLRFDRPYRRGERFTLELHLSTDNNLTHISRHTSNQKAVNSDSDIRSLESSGQVLFPFIEGLFTPIGKADYFIRGNDQHRIAFEGNVLSSGEQWHIQRHRQGFPQQLAYGDLQHQVLHWQGRRYHFVSTSQHPVTNDRQQQMAQLIEASLAFFAPHIPYESPYFYIDFSSNFDSSHAWARTNSMFLHWQSHNSPEDDLQLSRVHEVVHEAVHQWTCAGLARCANDNFLIRESITEYLTSIILAQNHWFPINELRGYRLEDYRLTHRTLRGLTATDNHKTIYYHKNHSLFYRLEALLGQEALVNAIMDYLQQHYDQQPIRLMSNQGLIKYLTRTFADQTAAILFLINHSEEFDFSVRGHQLTDQGTLYQIAMAYQEFKHQAAFPTHFSQSLDVAVLTEAGEQQLLSCTLSAEGCSLLVPTELNHKCVLLDPYFTYFDTNGSNVRYCSYRRQLL